MTTAWSYLLQGDLDNSVNANLAGTILCVLTMTATPWLALCGLVGRWIFWQPNLLQLLAIATVVMLVVLINWAYSFVS